MKGQKSFNLGLCFVKAQIPSKFGRWLFLLKLTHPRAVMCEIAAFALNGTYL